MLYLVATPIGNLSDISQRALETLRKVDYVASEDTRKTGRLLKHFGIKQRQISFHEHNEKRALPKILSLLKGGNSIALVTNAGTPGISDPGFTLVRAAIEAGIEVTMIPGPAAFVMAVVLSGLAVHSFVFRGYPPRKRTQRRRFLADDKESPYTLVFYESPHRLRGFLEDALEVFGDRRATLAKELTKLYESIKRGRLSQLLSELEEKPKGEYVVVIEGAE
jgi:16S rRNA (cytidine1402-2'-O)-methyltransferase